MSGPGITNKPVETSGFGNSWQSLAGFTEGLLKQLTLAGIFFYGLGLLIANTHYARYGVTEFSILKPQCIFTGLWAGLFMLCAALPSIACLMALKRYEDRPVWKRIMETLLAVFAGVFVATLTVSFISFFIATFDRTKGSWTTFWGMAPPGWATLLGVMNILTAISLPTLRKIPYKDSLRVAGAWLAMSGLAGAIAVGYEIYPVVNREAGGGLPERAYFLLGGKEGEATVSTIRGHINHSQDDLPTGLVDADLIFAGSDFFVLHIRFCTPDKAEGSLTPIVDKKLISSFFPPSAPPLPHAQDTLECH